MLQRYFQKYSSIAATALFFILSHIIFDKIYRTSVEVVDEEFHLSQAQDYCHYRFHKWNRKITTLPGLYYLSTVLCSPLRTCTTYCFRHVSLMAATVNLVLFNQILQLRNKHDPCWNVISSVNLSLLPPLYFFSHLYYTDVASLTTVLLTLYFNWKDKHVCAAFFGACSIFMRQTNALWVIMLAGQYLFNYIVQSSKPVRNRVDAPSCTNIKDLRHLSTVGLSLVYRLRIGFWVNAIAYATVILGFMLFIFVNGGIVVGDKSAHQAQLHIPQLFYFSLFTLVFGFPHLIGQLRACLTFIRNHLLTALGGVLYIMTVLYFNTLIHPYLLADNRHYVFYLWNRYFKTYAFQVAFTPAYAFGLYALHWTYYDNTNIWPYFMFIPCLFLSLCFQKLIELRYFLIPFVLWRLQIRNVKPTALAFEFALYLIINILTIKLFFEKEIRWDDRSEVQRLMW